MPAFKRIALSCCVSLFSAYVLISTAAGSAYGRNGDSLADPEAEPSGQEISSAAGAARRSVGAKSSGNPCDHLPPLRGKAKGLARKILQRCAAGASSSGISKGDFNGDGFADLAIGIPNEDTPAGTADSGAVIVIYGSVNGLTATSPSVPSAQFWSQNAPGIPGSSQAGDHFGAALASGDFNADGYSDLAIGIPGKDIVVLRHTFRDSGRVIVIYGSPGGLTTSNASVPPPRFFDFGVVGSSITGGEKLGSALAWGDFDGDGVGDLAMGAPNTQLIAPCIVFGFFTASTTFQQSGEVWILYGQKSVGLSTTGEQFLDDIRTGGSPPTAVICGSNFAGEHFGASLAAGNFNKDRFTDLVIGVPDRTVGTDDIPQGGEIAVNYGSAIGFGTLINGNPRTVLTGYGPTAPIPAAGDRYGSVLAVGDFNGDGFQDLAVGVPRRDLGAGTVDAGVVHVRFGSFAGLSSNGTTQLLSQNTLFPGDPINRSEANDQFGFALAAGDFNGDGFADLAIGVPFEDIISLRTGVARTVDAAGEVDVVYGSSSNLSITHRAPQIWNQDSINILDIAESGDGFGYSLTAWNFGKGSQADLAIGVPFEDVQQNNAPPGTMVTQAGAVNVIYGSPPGSTLSASNGLTTLGNQFWFASSPGIPSVAQPGAEFGLTLY